MVPRDKPKSQSMMVPSSSIRMLSGFMSRCMIPAEWENFKATSKLYMITIRLHSGIFCPCFEALARVDLSVFGMKVIMMKIVFKSL